MDVTSSYASTRAVPEEVLKTLRAYEKALQRYFEHRLTRREVDDTQWTVYHAVSTALSEPRENYNTMLQAYMVQQQELEERNREIARLRAVVEVERTAGVRIFKALRKEISARRPLSQGRECYEWDDDTYRKEFGWALDGIEQIVQAMERECRVGDLTDCPAAWDDVHGAREIARLTAELDAARAPRTLRNVETGSADADAGTPDKS
jgi:hypothetical protein